MIAQRVSKRIAVNNSYTKLLRQLRLGSEEDMGIYLFVFQWSTRAWPDTTTVQPLSAALCSTPRSWPTTECCTFGCQVSSSPSHSNRADILCCVIATFSPFFFGYVRCTRVFWNIVRMWNIVITPPAGGDVSSTPRLDIIPFHGAPTNLGPRITWQHLEIWTAWIGIAQ